MQIERLEQLIRLLEEIQEDGRQYNERFTYLDEPLSSNGLDNTRPVGDAVGWAGQDEWFQQQGLTSGNAFVEYAGVRGWPAVRAFFGINKQQRERIFPEPVFPDYRRPELMIQRINFLIEEQQHEAEIAHV